MKAGDLVFVKPYSFVGQSIKLLTGGEYSHIAIAVSEDKIFEAQYGKISGVYDITYENYDIKELAITEEQRKKLVEFVYTGDPCGREYDGSEIAGWIMQLCIWRLCKTANIDIIKYFDSKKEFICIEAVLYCFREALDIELVESKPEDLVLFSDILNSKYVI